MALKPTDLPTWNSTEERVEQPDATRQTTGWIWNGTKFEKAKGEHFNWLLNNQYKWLKYFDERLQLENSGFTTTLQSGTLTGDVIHTLPKESGEIIGAGNQTVEGVKSFALSPIVPAPTENDEVANKAYVDEQLIFPIVTGSATFTNSTNNIALTGFGALTGLEIGDVIQISGSTNNDTEFTVEVITDANNVIVNQAHAGGTTTKALVDETATVTVKLLAKWYKAPLGLGQGWVDKTASRAANTTYTISTGRPIMVSITTNGGAQTTWIAYVNAIPVDRIGIDGSLSNNGGGMTFIVPNASTYHSSGRDTWAELR